MDVFIAFGFAFWLGILTSVSPCPMATNIAAVAYIGRRAGSARKILLTGLLYTVGRVFTYTVLGALLATSILSTPHVSQFLQKYMNRLLGPILIIVGMILTGLLKTGIGGPGMSEKMQKRVESFGMFGAFLLGIIFAASFCPISAALFFGSLLATAVRVNSAVMVPAFYGLGTGLPVMVFALLIIGGGKKLSTAFERVTAFEKWARLITGGIFILAGIYYCLAYIFGVFA